MSVWRRMKLHSTRVERAGLVEDRVGDGDLADVVELGGAGHLVELLGAHVKLAPDRQRQLGRRRAGGRAGRAGARDSVRSRTSRDWRPADMRRPPLRAYMRRSAS